MSNLPRVRGILFFLGGLLIASGMIRTGFGLSSAQALAQDNTAAAALAPAPPLSCSDALKTVQAAFAERDERLTIREMAAEERFATLKLAEDLLKRRLEELTSAEASLSETLARADGAAENDLSRLTSVYEAMKPKDAAALFETMAPEFAAGFLGRIRPEAAAAILSGMSSETAYKVSVILAGRNTSVPRE